MADIETVRRRKIVGGKEPIKNKTLYDWEFTKAHNRLLKLVREGQCRMAVGREWDAKLPPLPPPPPGLEDVLEPEWRPSEQIKARETNGQLTLF
jgi:hypothetical protein